MRSVSNPVSGSHEAQEEPVDKALIPRSVLRDVSDYLSKHIDALERDYTCPASKQVDPEVTDEIAEVRGWIKQLRETVGESP